jgi:hypothetical protein
LIGGVAFLEPLLINRRVALHDLPLQRELFANGAQRFEEFVLGVHDWIPTERLLHTPHLPAKPLDQPTSSETRPARRNLHRWSEREALRHLPGCLPTCRAAPSHARHQRLHAVGSFWGGLEDRVA